MEARNLKLEVKTIRGREVLEKGSREHENASKSNDSGREIRERKQET